MRPIDRSVIMQKRQVLSLLFLFLLAAGIFAACSGTQQDAGDPGAAIEDYFSALVANETDKIPQLVCPAYESGARTEFDSMGAVGGAALENVECTSADPSNGDNATVTCTGAITFTYNGEDQSLDLSLSPYTSQKVDGEWKMCGYAQQE